MTTSKFIQLSNYRISTQYLLPQLMNEETPICIFLHEALGSIQQWRTFPIRVCQEVHLPGIIIERRGYGQSDPMNKKRDIHYLHEYCDELHEILKQILAPKQQVIIIGHSDGGTIGMLYAHYYPQHVKALSTLAAHTFMEEITLVGIRQTTEAFKAGKLDGLYKIHGDKTLYLFNAWSETRLDPSFMKWDIREEIKSINCPVLSIQGADDQYGSEGQLLGIKNAASNYSEVILPNVNHHPHLENTDKCVSDIADWIKKLGVSSATSAKSEISR